MDLGFAGGSYASRGGDRPESGAASADGGDPVLQQLDSYDAKLKNWRKWRAEAREMRDMVDGHQWPQEAIDAVLDEDETASPATFNRIAPMVDAITGAEITSRQVVKYSPRQVGDVAVNELMTGAADWARAECDAADEESQAFRDCIEIGLGVTETRMDYDDDPEGVLRVERIDPVDDKIEVWPATKSNFADARVIKRTRRFDKAEAYALFPGLCGGADDASASESDLSPHLNDPANRYDAERNEQNADGAPLTDGEVEICEYQWKQLERVTLVVDVNGQIVSLTDEQVAKLASGGINVQLMNSASVRRARYRRAFRRGSRVLVSDLRDGEFTYKFITGKLDRKTKLPYGVTRAMTDPQRWTNKFYLQMDRIFGANAKGGVLMELDAVEDQQQFEETYAGANKVTYVAEGAISGGKIQPKPAPPFPAIAHQLMQIAHNAVIEVTGVNKEMLGLAEREQAGVLEYQRKQAAFGVLAVFFDSLKRYRKQQGRLTLKYIREYMSDGRLVRITGGDGLEKYVPLLRDPNTARFDTIVDEAPTGPNQVERTWATFVQGAPMIKAMLEMGLPPQVIFTILEFSPFPSTFVSKLREQYMAAMQQAQGQDPMQTMMAQLQMADAQARVQKSQGEAALAHARAMQAGAEAQTAPQRHASDAQLKAAQAQAAQIESMLLPRERTAQAALSEARARQAHTEASLAPERVALDARDQALNFEQARMSHQANLMKFDGRLAFGVRQ